MKKTLIHTCLFLSIVSEASAAPKAIKFTLGSAFASGHSLIAVSPTGAATTQDLTGKKISITPKTNTAKLYVLDQNSRVAFQIVARTCKKKGANINCDKKGKTVVTGIKAGANLGKLKLVSAGALLSTFTDLDSYKKSLVAAQTSDAINFVPVGISTAGLNKGAGATVARNGIKALDTSDDGDQDGLVNALDRDDNGNGVLDNYDSSSSSSVGSSSFNVFSNLKLDIDQSLNLHATGLSTSRIDTALQAVQSLAIQVAGSTTDSVELDCGTLNYCSSGGTGTANNANFPGTAGGSFDSDGNGLGTITRGATGDFQLQTHTTSAKIGAGDTFVQRVTSSGVVTEIPGMLNFAFVSTPAIKTIAVNSDAAQTIDYASNPIKGSRQNCIIAPATGNVSLTITGWRPQRPGDTDASESEYVDIGKSLIVADIPNGQCDNANGGNCVPQGPGSCGGTYYSTSDSNLSTNNNGVQDAKVDTNADATNTYTFTFDLTGCLAGNRSPAVTFDSGKTIFIDLQFKSANGDNAAQKFCVTRS